MKKWLCLVLGICMLLAMTGCEGKSDVLSSTGEYNGQKITMSYKVTDVNYPEDMRSIEMQQGYAVFYDRTFWDPASDTNPYPGDTWNLLDRDGNRLLNQPYMYLTSFNNEGVTVAQKMDGSYVQLDIRLKETPITEQQYTAFQLDGKNNLCSKTYPQGEYHYSCVNNEMAIYVEMKDKDSYAGEALVGLTDKDGNVIIPAFIPIHYSKMTERLHLSEGMAFVQDYVTNHIGIITVTQS